MVMARFRPSETVDFVVIGSGAAGGVVAKELSTAGFRVVVLEQGPYLREKDFTHDEVKFLRQIAVSPNGVATFISTRKQHVYALTDRGKSGVADDVKLFAASLDMQLPHGVCFSKDGFLYIAERNRVIVYPAAEYFYEGNDVVAVPIVKQGELIPVDEESYNHTARICRVGPDDRLYISLGSALQRAEPGKVRQIRPAWHRRHPVDEARWLGSYGLYDRRA